MNLNQESVKNMIATVSLNPAIDRTMTADDLVTGEVNRMKSSVQYAGGKGINVTKMLRNLDEEACALGFLGGFAGKFILDYLETIGVDCRFTMVPSETRTSLNIITDSGEVTEILEPGAAIPAESEKEFRVALGDVTAETKTIVMSGSLQTGLHDDYYAELIEICRTAGAKVILDTSGKAFAAGASAKPFLIKPNLRELETLAGEKLDTEGRIALAVNNLRESGIDCVVVSRGKQGLFSVDGNDIIKVAVPYVPVVNTVGSGDVCVALLADKLQNVVGVPSRDQLTDAMVYAAAFSAANVTTKESGNVPLETAERMLGEVQVSTEKIK
ncbi:MAG: 1-phosphofructokinase family hexose kinase [Clostridiales bacterium]|nr:1-phosphofructokinase family hexose kinase [Clostridiales bacterium]